ncbi:hypothetical protein [Aquimarina sp. AU474]|uniref:hypothetical protein n=1 Tax=Aquimarina sp. AU474 TaxID=2108529 RepID=UPI000D689657|nr:hypothetical protein [Aquimarina sp. AU474]
MKKTIITVGMIFLFFSCGKDKQKEEGGGLMDMIEGVSDLNKMAKEAEKIEEENEKLVTTIPISNEALKSMLPESLLGHSRKKFSVGNQFMPDVAMGEAEYEKENGDIISLSIIDGAGETGSAMVTLARLSFARDFEEQSDRGYRKSTTINGYKAVEEVEKDDYSDAEDAKIDLMVANRFLISVEGQNMSVNQLKKAVDELDLKSLEQKAN